MDPKKFREQAHKLLQPKDSRGPNLDIILANRHEKTFWVRSKHQPRPCDDCDQIVENRVVVYRRIEQSQDWEKICSICREKTPVLNPNDK